MTPDTNMDDHQAIGKSNPRNNPTIFKIFQNVQYNVVQHKKYVKELIKLYKKIDQNFFRESFKNALHYLFTFGDTSASVDRVIQFVATFCTSLNDEEEFLMFIFEVIFECQCLSGQSIRYRASQLLAAVLSALGDDASLDDDLCDKLLASQMERLQDTRGAVRCRAALALQRLQNPLDSDDPVTRAYRFHMSCDPSSSVRRAIVMSIAKSTRNVPFVLERLCDVDEAVRRAAFLYISAINVTQLRVRQRIHTLKVGLNERAPRVRRVVEEIVIPSWLSIFQGNIIDLLKAIRLDNSQDAKDSQYVAGKLLESLFKRLPISELLEWLPTDKSLRLITAEKLNKETTWYWRHLAEHLQKIGDDETLETVLPDLVVLTGYIRAIVESPCPSQKEDPVGFSTRQYVLQELGSMLRVYDASDPAGRTALQALIQDTLTGDHGPLSAEVIRAFVLAIELAIPDVGERIKCICQMVSTLRNPPEVEEEPVPFAPTDCTEIKLQRARLRVSLNVAMEAQEEAVKDENYALASECKAKVADIQKKLEELNLQTNIPQPQPLSTEKEKQIDSETMNKCLIILNSALDTPQLKTILPTLQLVYDDLEPEILQNPDILENALETVALFAMLDKNFLREHKSFFFTHLLDTTNEAVVATVLKCIVDILCVHGARVFEDEVQNESKIKEKKINKRNSLDDIDYDESTMSLSSALSTVIELLLNIMNTDNPTFRLIIVDGLCRLIYLGHLESPAIISRLLLLWFNPATVDEDNLRQTIGIFFQTFPVSVDGAQEQIQKATIPTLRALANAPSSSPLAEIDQEAVVRFLVSLTRFNHELIDSQGTMAMTLVGYLMRKPTCSEVGLACRMLALLSPPRDTRTTFDLIKMLRELNQKLPDKQSCRNLTRYLGALEASERASLNKMSTGTEGIIQAEDSIQTLGRTTASLTVPLAWSTHVVINDVVTEETEIDETSPTRISKISHDDNSSEERKSLPLSTDTEVRESKENSEDGSSGVLSVKRVKVTKEKKKTLSMNRKTDAKKTKQKSAKEDKKEQNEKGVKRSRSQRSLVDVDRAKKEAEEKCNKEMVQQSPPLDDFDVSNVTVRKSTRGLQSGSSTDSNGSGKGKKGRKPQKKKGQQEIPRRSTRSSNGSSRSSESFTLDNSGDETELHTIVYDNDIQQEILNDSSQINTTSKANVVIPETPDGSEESESESEVVTKGKHKK